MADNTVQEISWLGARLREPSTYAGLGILLGLIFHVSNSANMAANLQTVGIGVGMLITGIIAMVAPEAKIRTIVKPLVLFFIAVMTIAMLGLVPAFAGDITPPIVAKAPTYNSYLPASTPCTPTSCSGFYVGAFMAGNGTNADIVGNGINGSVFAGGGIPGIDVGYQLANGTYFAAAEAAIGYQVSVATGVNSTTGSAGGNESGIFAQEIFKVGGSLGSLLGTQNPINVPSQLQAALISPYVLVGAVERPWANGWATGAGATFDLAPQMFLDIRYEYINYGVAGVGALTFNSENLVTVGLNWKR